MLKSTYDHIFTFVSSFVVPVRRDGGYLEAVKIKVAPELGAII